jgi:hypothetical protein
MEDRQVKIIFLLILKELKYFQGTLKVAGAFGTVSHIVSGYMDLGC